MALPQIAEQTESEIRTAVAPILAAWITRATEYDLPLVQDGKLTIHRIGRKVVGWELRVGPADSLMPTKIFNYGHGATLGRNGDASRAEGFAFVLLTDRQLEKLTSEVVA